MQTSTSLDQKWPSNELASEEPLFEKSLIESDLNTLQEAVGLGPPSWWLDPEYAVNHPEVSDDVPKLSESPTNEEKMTLLKWCRAPFDCAGKIRDSSQGLLNRLNELEQQHAQKIEKTSQPRISKSPDRRARRKYENNLTRTYSRESIGQLITSPRTAEPNINEMFERRGIKGALNDTYDAEESGDEITNLRDSVDSRAMSDVFTSKPPPAVQSHLGQFSKSRHLTYNANNASVASLTHIDYMEVARQQANSLRASANQGDPRFSTDHASLRMSTETSRTHALNRSETLFPRSSVSPSRSLVTPDRILNRGQSGRNSRESLPYITVRESLPAMSSNRLEENAAMSHEFFNGRPTNILKRVIKGEDELRSSLPTSFSAVPGTAPTHLSGSGKNSNNLSITDILDKAKLEEANLRASSGSYTKKGGSGVNLTHSLDTSKEDISDLRSQPLYSRVMNSGDDLRSSLPTSLSAAAGAPPTQLSGSGKNSNNLSLTDILDKAKLEEANLRASSGSFAKQRGSGMNLTHSLDTSREDVSDLKPQGVLLKVMKGEDELRCSLPTSLSAAAAVVPTQLSGSGKNSNNLSLTDILDKAKLEEANLRASSGSFAKQHGSSGNLTQSLDTSKEVFSDLKPRPIPTRVINSGDELRSSLPVFLTADGPVPSQLSGSGKNSNNLSITDILGKAKLEEANLRASGGSFNQNASGLNLAHSLDTNKEVRTHLNRSYVANTEGPELIQKIVEEEENGSQLFIRHSVAQFPAHNRPPVNKRREGCLPNSQSATDLSDSKVLSSSQTSLGRLTSESITELCRQQAKSLRESAEHMNLTSGSLHTLSRSHEGGLFEIAKSRSRNDSNVSLTSSLYDKRKELLSSSVEFQHSPQYDVDTDSKVSLMPVVAINEHKSQADMGAVGSLEVVSPHPENSDECGAPLLSRRSPPPATRCASPPRLRKPARNPPANSENLPTQKQYPPNVPSPTSAELPTPIVDNLLPTQPQNLFTSPKTARPGSYAEQLINPSMPGSQIEAWVTETVDISDRKDNLAVSTETVNLDALTTNADKLAVVPPNIPTLIQKPTSKPGHTPALLSRNPTPEKGPMAVSSVSRLPKSNLPRPSPSRESLVRVSDNRGVSNQPNSRPPSKLRTPTPPRSIRPSVVPIIAKAEERITSSTSRFTVPSNRPKPGAVSSVVSRPGLLATVPTKTMPSPTPIGLASTRPPSRSTSSRQTVELRDRHGPIPTATGRPPFSSARPIALRTTPGLQGVRPIAPKTSTPASAAKRSTNQTTRPQIKRTP